jgi:hypothetical protein
MPTPRPSPLYDDSHELDSHCMNCGQPKPNCWCVQEEIREGLSSMTMLGGMLSVSLLVVLIIAIVLLCRYWQ